MVEEYHRHHRPLRTAGLSFYTRVLSAAPRIARSLTQILR